MLRIFHRNRRAPFAPVLSTSTLTALEINEFVKTMMEVLIHGNLMTDHAFDLQRRASMAKNYNVFDSMQLSHALIWILYTYARYGKDFSVRFDPKNLMIPATRIGLSSMFTISDIISGMQKHHLREGHITSYVEDSLATFFTTCNDEMYRTLSQGPQHRAVLQYNKQ